MEYFIPSKVLFDLVTFDMLLFMCRYTKPANSRQSHYRDELMDLLTSDDREFDEPMDVIHFIREQGHNGMYTDFWQVDVTDYNALLPIIWSY